VTEFKTTVTIRHCGPFCEDQYIDLDNKTGECEFLIFTDGPECCLFGGRLEHDSSTIRRCNECLEAEKAALKDAEVPMIPSGELKWMDFRTWGHRIVREDGYVLRHCPTYPMAKPNGYVFEHRLVMAASIGRSLEKDEHVHHINGDRQDNRPENLLLLSNSEHRRMHSGMMTLAQKQAMAFGLIRYARKRRLPRSERSCACGCGRIFVTPDDRGRFHSYIRGHNQTGRNWRWNRG
jgi:hypothetical protein